MTICNKHTLKLMQKSLEAEYKNCRKVILDVIKKEKNNKENYIKIINQNKNPLTEKELKYINETSN